MVGKTISHYQILEKLGEGGMGVVYKAKDTHLDRFVAIKILPAEKVTDPERKRRFVQEAKAASALNHPNIITIYDIGADAGTDFIAMEYVEGKTLDQMIPHHGMRLNEALKCAVQIADALAAAHEAGILHRDLKPGNVMVTDKGHVKVLDFGLAKLTEAAPLGAEDNTRTMRPVTEEGAIVGTVAYMSPEQAEGRPVDTRSDIFSFGSVLYEMVTGRQAFRGNTKVSALASIIKEEPPPLGAQIPHDTERVVRRCLRKDPARRFQTMGDLKVALEELKEESDSGKPTAAQVQARAGKRRFLWPAVAAAGVLVLAAGSVFFWQRLQAKPLTERDWIVLADFTNTTGDPVFDGALKQALSAQLNQSPYLNVLPDERVDEVLRLMERPPEERLTGRVAREACVRAGVKALLAGSIAAVGNHYSIGLDATNCSTGDTLAQEQVEAANKDQVLGALGQAASKMRRKLGESLASIRKLDTPIEEATTSSLEALKAFGLGNEQRVKARNRESIPFYRRAIELDPNFAQAYESLGLADNNLSEFSVAQPLFAKAFELRQRTSERERLSIESSYYRITTGELEKAGEAYRVLTQMYPRDWLGFNGWGLLHRIVGQHEKAADLFREASRLSGGAAVYPVTNMAGAYLDLNRYAEARTMYEQAVARFDSPTARAALYLLAWAEGDAVVMKRQLAQSQGEDSAMLWAQATVAASGGQLQKGRDLQRRAVEMLKRAGGQEYPANYLSAEGVFEAYVGNLPQAREAVTAALGLARGRLVLYRAALVEALAGSGGSTEALLSELTKRYPQDTMVNKVAVPVTQASLEISRGNPRRAVELLEGATPYELGIGIGCGEVLYLRGQAHLRAGAGREAAAAFQKILDHRGRFNSGTYPLAFLGLGRAQALAGNTAEAREAYQDFLALWKDADPDIPILKEAKLEYAKLK